MYFGKSKPSKRRAHSHVLVDCLRRSLRCFLNAAALTLPSIIFFLHVAEWNAASAIIKPPCFSKNSLLLLHILHPSAAGTTHALSGTPPPTSLFSYTVSQSTEKNLHALLLFQQRIPSICFQCVHGGPLCLWVKRKNVRVFSGKQERGFSQALV